MSAYNKSIKPKKLNILDKVVKKNPKYAHIGSTIDTGSSLTKYMRKLEEIKTNYRYQQNEIFRRIKISTFVQLILQIANIDLPSISEDDGESSRTLVTDTRRDGASSYANDENKYPKLLNTIQGVGEQDILRPATNNTHVAAAASSQVYDSENPPYLLLDLRDKDDFSVCHIKSAYSYPIAMLSRSINNETRELLQFKNQEGKIIVIYDEDEKIAPRAASTLVERGYDNLFMLSGGLKLAAKKFPEGLIYGKLPEHLVEKPVVKSKTPVQATPPDNTEEFDADKLNFFLENTLLSSDTSSRLSSRTSRFSDTGSVNSVNSRTSQLSKATSIHSQPWKPT